MKNFKRKSFLSFAILAILLAQLFGGVVLALEYEVLPEQEIVVDEIQPMAATNCSITLSENDALNYAISFIGANTYVDPSTGYTRSNTTNGFKQVRFDLNAASPHINCEIFVYEGSGRYRQTYNMHVYII